MGWGELLWQNTNIRRQFIDFSPNIWRPLIAYKPDDTAEDDDEDDQDKQSPGRDRNDDGQLLGVGDMDAGVGEGQGHVALRHPAVVDGDTGILSQVCGGHTGHSEAEVPLNAAWVLKRSYLVMRKNYCGENIEGLAKRPWFSV